MRLRRKKASPPMEDLIKEQTAAVSSCERAAELSPVALEADRVVLSSGNVQIGGQMVVISQDGTLLRTMPCPVPAPDRPVTMICGNTTFR